MTYTDFTAAVAALSPTEGGVKRPNSAFWAAWIREMHTTADAERVLAVAVAYASDGDIDRAVEFEAREHAALLV